MGLQGFPAILPPHFGSLRLPLGFSSDPHNHFAAFRKFKIQLAAMKMLWIQIIAITKAKDK